MSALSLAACRAVPSNAAASTAARSSLPAPEAVAESAMAHGDHEPHHGGTVYMYKEVHYEVVFDVQGRHRIYFSDAVREDLPASVASGVTLVISRPSFSPEPLAGAIDEHGESWAFEGAPVTHKGTTARVSFTVNQEPYWIDVPFLTGPPSAAVSQ